MSRYYYDLHIHSCLSPCGDDDMTPANIAGMAALKGLQIVALCDHNTTANVPAFMTACKNAGIIPVPGIEVTTAEDIHLLCLFRTVEPAMTFGSAVQNRLVKVENRPDIFGRQIIMNEADMPVGEYGFLLLNATDMPLEEATGQCRKLGGFCCPAHIDRESNGAAAILGTFPDWLGYTAFEISSAGSREKENAKFPCLSGMRYLKNSDAHYLWDISEAENWLELDDEPYSSQLVRDRLIDYLEGGAGC